MKLIVCTIAIVLIVIVIALIRKQNQNSKVKAHDKEMENKFNSIMNNLSTMPDEQLSDMIVDLAMTEIIYDTMLEERGEETANRLCGYEEYGCRTHDEKNALFVAIQKEQQKREKNI